MDEMNSEMNGDNEEQNDNPILKIINKDVMNYLPTPEVLQANTIEA